MLTDRDLARFDADDPLTDLRDQFVLPLSRFYFAGHSLGPPTQSAVERVRSCAETEWAGDLVSGWNTRKWIDLPATVGAKIAGLIGASPSEVVVLDSTSIVLYKLLANALRLRPGRSVILSVDGNFPSDLHVAHGLAQTFGAEVRSVSAGEVPTALGPDVAVFTAGHVDFRTGELLDLPAITEAVHRVGALVVWDLAHSAGVVPINLNQHEVDFAVGCGYKYLSGGPGAPAFAFVAERHHRNLENPIPGWLGSQEPFAFDPVYRPADGVRRLITGTPPVLSLVALDAALETVSSASIDAVRAKSIALGDTLIKLFDERPAGGGFELISPDEGSIRGSQVAFRHQNAYPISRALAEAGVTVDFRAPDVLRFGLGPLYTRFGELGKAIDRLLEIMESDRWREPRFSARQVVT